tara:strand:- start:3633 stop:4553 length:921 start_codon:yes stop_codon:yes gene_type:complete
MAIITAARYNSLQATVENVMGNGAGQFGYGQTLASSQVAADTVIDSGHMSTLYTDLINARVHQVGSVPNSVATVSAGDVIEEDATDTGTARGILQYEDLASTVETDKALIYTADTSQSTITANKTNSSSTNAWAGVRDHVVTVTFATADARRHFFNAGGEIRFTADLDPAASNGKNNDWNSLLANMGTVTFKSNNCPSLGSSPGTSFNIGNFDMTATDQLVFQKDGTGVYAENDYNIKAKELNSTTIQFTIQFRDDDVGDDTNNDGAFNPQDESVTGTLQSVVGERLPTGSRVSLTSPTFNTTNTL